MRVDPFFVANLVSPLDQTQVADQQLTAELSSGVRVNSLSQDPMAAGQNVLLLSQIQQDDSFTQTASLVNGRLQVADSALGQVVSQLTTAISLATSANNGTMNASNLQSISNQIAGIRSEITSLANSNYQGEYIFAGGNVSAAPFTTSASGSPVTTTYNGDEDVISLQTPDGQSIPLNVPGNQIFTAAGANSVFAALNNLVADFANDAPAATSVADTQALNSAMNYVSQQRVLIDNSISRLNASSEAISSQKTQLIVAQTNLMQADVAQVSTQLSLSESQQTALESVISQLGSNSLFNKM